MREIKFKKGDAVPRWIAIDQGNPDAKIVFGQDVDVESSDVMVRVTYKDINSYVMEGDESCSGDIQGAPNHKDGLFIKYVGDEVSSINNPILEPIKKQWSVHSEFSGLDVPCIDYESYSRGMFRPH